VKAQLSDAEYAAPSFAARFQKDAKASAQCTKFLSQHEAKYTLLTQQEAKDALSCTSNIDKLLFRMGKLYNCNQLTLLRYIRTDD
jgi:hypothetical protein